MMKSFCLSLLCLFTITACAHPVDQELRARSVERQKTFQTSGSISAGACDDLGQLIPGNNQSQIHVSASAVPIKD